MNDRALVDANEIAYVSMNYLENLMRTSKEELSQFSVNDIIDSHNESEGENQHIDNLSPNAASWRIIDYLDTNNTTGFAAVVIDAGNGELIVAFRGSEGMEKTENIRHDWVNADLVLVTNPRTAQQAEVERLLQQIAAKDYIKNYHTIHFTGHSLGGNLAVHAGVMAETYGIPAEKIGRIVNFDGPGFSQEYIAINERSINRVESKITEYKWSAIGEMLTPLSDQQIAVQVEPRDDLWYNFVLKHAQSSLIYDENGMLIPGEPDATMFATRYTSRGLDHLPWIIGAVIVGGIGLLAMTGSSMKDVLFEPSGGLSKIGWVVGLTASAAAGYYIGVVGLKVAVLKVAMLFFYIAGGIILKWIAIFFLFGLTFEWLIERILLLFRIFWYIFGDMFEAMGRTLRDAGAWQVQTVTGHFGISKFSVNLEVNESVQRRLNHIVQELFSLKEAVRDIPIIRDIHDDVSLAVSSLARFNEQFWALEESLRAMT